MSLPSSSSPPNISTHLNQFTESDSHNTNNTAHHQSTFNSAPTVDSPSSPDSSSCPGPETMENSPHKPLEEDSNKGKSANFEEQQMETEREDATDETLVSLPEPDDQEAPLTKDASIAPASSENSDSSHIDSSTHATNTTNGNSADSAPRTDNPVTTLTTVTPQEPLSSPKPQIATSRYLAKKRQGRIKSEEGLPATKMTEDPIVGRVSSGEPSTSVPRLSTFGHTTTTKKQSDASSAITTATSQNTNQTPQRHLSVRVNPLQNASMEADEAEKHVNELYAKSGATTGGQQAFASSAPSSRPSLEERSPLPNTSPTRPITRIQIKSNRTTTMEQESSKDTRYHNNTTYLPPKRNVERNGTVLQTASNHTSSPSPKPSRTTEANTSTDSREDTIIGSYLKKKRAKRFAHNDKSFDTPQRKQPFDPADIRHEDALRFYKSIHSNGKVDSEFTPRDNRQKQKKRVSLSPNYSVLSSDEEEEVPLPNDAPVPFSPPKLHVSSEASRNSPSQPSPQKKPSFLPSPSIVQSTSGITRGRFSKPHLIIDSHSDSYSQEANAEVHEWRQQTRRKRTRSQTSHTQYEASPSSHSPSVSDLSAIYPPVRRQYYTSYAQPSPIHLQHVGSSESDEESFPSKPIDNTKWNALLETMESDLLRKKTKERFSPSKRIQSGFMNVAKKTQREAVLSTRERAQRFIQKTQQKTLQSGQYSMSGAMDQPYPERVSTRNTLSHQRNMNNKTRPLRKSKPNKSRRPIYREVESHEILPPVDDDDDTLSLESFNDDSELSNEALFHDENLDSIGSRLSRIKNKTRFLLSDVVI